MILSLTIWLPSFQSWICYQSFNHPYYTPKDPPKTKKTLYHLSIILLLQDLLQVYGIIHPPTVYKALLLLLFYKFYKFNLFKRETHVILYQHNFAQYVDFFKLKKLIYLLSFLLKMDTNNWIMSATRL
jgi:hypothetical protein